MKEKRKQQFRLFDSLYTKEKNPARRKKLNRLKFLFAMSFLTYCTVEDLRTAIFDNF